MQPEALALWAAVLARRLQAPGGGALPPAEAAPPRLLPGHLLTGAAVLPVFIILQFIDYMLCWHRRPYISDTEVMQQGRLQAVACILGATDIPCPGQELEVA